jgi:hypothetical protein
MIGHIANLEKSPLQQNEYSWADYIELLAFQNPDKEMSKADLLNRIQERKDFGEIDSIAQPTAPDEARRDDRLSQFVNDCFRNLEYRLGAFGDAYPFILTEKGKILRRKEQMLPLNKLYTFLLLAANLKYIAVKQRNDITAMFEIISLEALKNYLSRNASTIHFGTNPYNTNSRYKGKLSKRILNLAADLNEQAKVSEEDFDSRNTGDAGLDLVAFFPFQDNVQGMLYIFCQCACTEDWESKQHDCSFQAWDNKIMFTSFFSHMVLIPFCYRNATGTWFDHLQIKKSILVDRVRLINLLKVSPESLPNIKNLPSVEEFLSEEESLF